MQKSQLCLLDSVSLFTSCETQRILIEFVEMNKGHTYHTHQRKMTSERDSVKKVHLLFYQPLPFYGENLNPLPF